MPVDRFNECPKCGELNRRTSARCGVCGYEFPPEQVIEPSQMPGPHSDAVIGLLILMLVVCLGVTLIAPGLGIALALLMIGPLIRTSLVMTRRSERGRQTPFAQALAMFVGSVVVTAIILTVVGVAAFGTFCLVCLGVYESGHRDVALMMAVVAAIAVCIPICIGFAKWSLRRWRRETGEE